MDSRNNISVFCHVSKQWKKENEADLRSQFEGDDSEFATHIVTHFRKNVTKEDKQRYKEMADSQSLVIDL
uniref:Uncharacterized protein n=1 Tax=Panagrolaimus sp. JU765 TaxID=591449 RepID=A0AC34PZT3_9BILA